MAFLFSIKILHIFMLAVSHQGRVTLGGNTFIIIYSNCLSKNAQTSVQMTLRTATFPTYTSECRHCISYLENASLPNWFPLIPFIECYLAHPSTAHQILKKKFQCYNLLLCYNCT